MEGHSPQSSTHLFGLVDALQVAGRDVGTEQRLACVLIVALQDLALQINTHRTDLVPPLWERKREEKWDQD